ncbi:MAG: N-acyl-L-amino acid amidohydrolase [Hyphococcus sp.]|nr:MAG: N-acyl-L-amino acid amidohydrolase [Marinicaulis sp.]
MKNVTCLFFYGALLISSYAFTVKNAAAESASEIHAAISASVEENRDDLIAFRRDLHQHPEVSGREERTARKVTEELKALGFTVTTNVGGHGVVALLEGAKPGPLVAFRADMDAVNSNWPDPVEFSSLRPGVRHVCGHDIHTTIGVALAHGFAANRDDIAGSVLLIFQPAEETASGARDMLASTTLFNDNPPDAIFAYHTAPYETGIIATARTRLMVARDRIRITLSATDSLGPIANDIKARLEALATVTNPRTSQPLDSDFVHIDGVRASIDNNGSSIVQTFASLATDKARADLRASVGDIIATTKAAHPDLVISSTYDAEYIPGVLNDPQLVEQAVHSAQEILDGDSIIFVEQTPPTFSEDFGHFQKQAPGVMFFLGVSNQENGWRGYPHTPDYVADEEAIFVGANVMSKIMLDVLSSD